MAYNILNKQGEVVAEGIPESDLNDAMEMFNGESFEELDITLFFCSWIQSPHLGLHAGWSKESTH